MKSGGGPVCDEVASVLTTARCKGIAGSNICPPTKRLLLLLLLLLLLGWVSSKSPSGASCDAGSLLRLLVLVCIIATDADGRATPGWGV
jgi:hypothetical protein